MRRRAQVLRSAFACVPALAALFGSIGCTQNHYYGAVPMCSEPAAVVSYGEVCEVPGTITSGPILAEAPRTRIVTPGTRTAAAPRVLVSEPLGSRFAWRRPDPESLATTRVEGGVPDDEMVR